MRPCFQVEITTPKNVLLNGLLFGLKRSKNLYIFVHGLTGSAFSMRGLGEVLVDKNSSVLTFNTRGFEQISTVKRRRGNKTEYLQAGTAHEKFGDCVDDIQGAVDFGKKAGFKSIYLVGHSTGCNKAVYWHAKGGQGVQALFLLGPLSDYSGALASKGRLELARGVACAQKLVRSGKPHALMPRDLGEWFECDAQRFLSLYTPESEEDIFTYARQEVRPRALERVRTPMLVILAGADEYADKPVTLIEQWFLEHIYTGEVVVIPNVNHSFKGGERTIVKTIRRFMAEFA